MRDLPNAAIGSGMYPRGSRSSAETPLHVLTLTPQNTRATTPRHEQTGYALRWSAYAPARGRDRDAVQSFREQNGGFNR